MKASVMDLRYKTKDVLRALEAQEEIILTHRGTTKGKIVPIEDHDASVPSLLDHPAIGMWKNDGESVPAMIERIRKPRTC
ncbi:MAG: type II toxin-antitoxin system prevent-host-death family antitoxin [Luteolibacter sp.]